jgi:probable phosphoglycerate mutase
VTSALPKLFLVRHGDTAWTDSHRHTGRTDLPLNESGEEHARQIGAVLSPVSFSHVFTSPLQRAAKTCALAGFGDVAESDLDLLEWDYGLYEGKLTGDIVKERPGWELFRDGCPGRESARDVAGRANRFLARVQGLGGNVLAFSSGHIIRVIAARWLGLPPAGGRLFYCGPASVGVLGFEHDSRDQPIVRLWNYDGEPLPGRDGPNSAPARKKGTGEDNNGGCGPTADPDQQLGGRWPARHGVAFHFIPPRPFRFTGWGGEVE